MILSKRINKTDFNKLAAKTFQNTLVRFFLVSGLNTVFGYSIFASLIYFGLKYQLALLISTIIGILFNFKTTGSIVFRNPSNILIFKFFGVYGVTYLVNLAGISILKYFGISVYIGGALLLVPIGLLAFVLNRKFVFSTKKIVKIKNKENK